MAVIRPGLVEDLPHLPDIENQAALRLRDAGGQLGALYTLFSAHVTAPETFEAYQQAGRLWVAVEDQHPVGFIVVSVMGNSAHIDEVDVLPAYGRRGIGSALIKATCDWAREHGLNRVTLSTQRNVAWNKPYYEKLGFRVMAIDEWTVEHQQIREAEAQLGFPMADRVLMKLDL